MYVDLPKLTRCCFCIPLRYGLQVWGYIKLLLDMALLILILPNTWAYLVEDPLRSPFLVFVLLNISTDIIFSIFLVIATYKYTAAVILMVCKKRKLITSTLDLHTVTSFFQGVFFRLGHCFGAEPGSSQLSEITYTIYTDRKLFKLYINYSLLFVVVMASGVILNLFILIRSIYFYYDTGFFNRSGLEVPIMNAVMILGFTVLQVYIILLARAEMDKLRNNTNVQFFNQTCDPQVKMTIEKTVLSA